MKYAYCVLPDNLCILLVLAFAVPPFAKHDRGIHIGRGEGVGLIEQRDDTKQDGPDERKTRTMRTLQYQILSSFPKECSTRAFWICSSPSSQPWRRRYLTTSPLLLNYMHHPICSEFQMQTQHFTSCLGENASCWHAKFKRNSENYPAVVSCSLDVTQNCSFAPFWICSLKFWWNIIFIYAVWTSHDLSCFSFHKQAGPVLYSQLSVVLIKFIALHDWNQYPHHNNDNREAMKRLLDSLSLLLDGFKWIWRQKSYGRDYLTFCVGFHLSEGSSPLWGSSTGGCRIEMHTSPFWRERSPLIVKQTNTDTSLTCQCVI